MRPENIKRVGEAFFGKFNNLKDVQKKAFEPILTGKNAIIISATGSGKTEAAIAPLIARYFDSTIKKSYPFLLYITPTKALVNDIEKRLEPPLSSLGLRLGIRHGDRNDLNKKNKPNILITTPESLDVILFEKDFILNYVKALILDEIHFLYNNQRGLHLAILLNRLRNQLNSEFQWVALSATIADPDNYVEFFFPYCDANSVIKINSTTKREIEALICAVKKPTNLFSKIFLSNYKEKVLAFTNSRKTCEGLANDLKEIDILRDRVFCHYSSLSPEIRHRVEKEFYKRDSALCIATSTLELGIDIGNINCIVLWDVPPSVESFLQRIGRGNRKEKKIRVICAIPEYSKNKLLSALKYLSLCILSSRGYLAPKKPFKLYSPIVQQCLNIIASNGGSYIPKKELYNSFKVFSYVKESDFYNILDNLSEKGYLKKHSFYDRYGAGEKLHDLEDSFEIYGNIARPKKEIILKQEDMPLGYIPNDNIYRIKKGDQILFSGKVWEVSDIKNSAIDLKPASNINNNRLVDISYKSDMAISEPYIVDYIWRFIHDDNILELNDINIHKNLRSLLDDYIKFIKNNFNVQNIPYIKINDRFIYFTFAGEIINHVLSYYGNNEESKNIGNDIVFVSRKEINWAELPKILKNCEDDIFNYLFYRLNLNIYQKLLPEYILKLELLELWKRDLSITDIIKRLEKSEPKLIKNNEYEYLKKITAEG